MTALGTEFTVRVYSSAKRPVRTPKLVLAVSVAEGSVKVDAQGKASILAAGQQRVFGDDGDQNNHDDGDQNNQGNQGSGKKPR